MNVYAAYIVVSSQIPDVDDHEPLREEQVWIISAATFEEAEIKVAELTEGESISYENMLGEMVTWKLERKSDLIELGTVEAMANGLEVMSKFSEKRLTRFDKWFPV